MAYLPYRMYGNGNFHLPIIDIVQTINSTTQACRTNNVNKTPKPATTTSNKGFPYTRREFENLTKKFDKQGVKYRKKKSASYDFLPKESRNDDELKISKRGTISKTKILRYRKNGPQAPTKLPNYERANDAIGEKKSLQVLFKTAKSNSVFDRDGADEDESNFSFLWSPFVSSSDLKRKGSFVDYIKVKRRK